MTGTARFRTFDPASNENIKRKAYEENHPGGGRRLLTTIGASAQDKGDWTLGPTLNIYAHTGDGAVVGIGASARYNILDALRIEPGLTT